MIESEKEHGFMDIIKDGLRYISQTVSSSIFPPIAEGAEMVIKKIEDSMTRTVQDKIMPIVEDRMIKTLQGRIIPLVENRIMRMEKRILSKISSIFVMGFGGALLVFALFFFLIESFGWSNSLAFFLTGIIIFVIGLFLGISYGR